VARLSACARSDGAAIRGELERGDIARITGLPERTSRSGQARCDLVMSKLESPSNLMEIFVQQSVQHFVQQNSHEGCKLFDLLMKFCGSTRFTGFMPGVKQLFDSAKFLLARREDSNLRWNSRIVRSDAANVGRLVISGGSYPPRGLWQRMQSNDLLHGDAHRSPRALPLRRA
jgi:hypothetical protein